MKKSFLLVVLLGLALGAGLTGCSQSDQTPAAPAAPSAPSTNAPAHP